MDPISLGCMLQVIVGWGKTGGRVRNKGRVRARDKGCQAVSAG